MNTTTVIAAALLSALSFNASAVAKPTLPGSDYYSKQQDEAAMKGRSAVADDALTSRIDSLAATQTFGYSTLGQPARTYGRSLVPGSNFFEQQHNEAVQHGVR